MLRQVVLVNNTVELSEGVQDMDVALICEPDWKPSPYPDNIIVNVDCDFIPIEKLQKNGVYLYFMGVEVKKDMGVIYFIPRSEIQKKVNVQNELKIITNAEKKQKREKRYASETDVMFFKIIEAEWTGNKAVADKLKKDYLKLKNKIRKDEAYE